MAIKQRLLKNQLKRSVKTSNKRVKVTRLFNPKNQASSLSDLGNTTFSK